MCMGSHDVAFILDLIPATTGSSVVFTIPLYPSFIPSLPLLIPSLFLLHSLIFLRNASKATHQRAFVEFPRGFKEVSSSLTDCPSCPSLFLANEERAGGCHGNPEEAQWHGPQHRGRQGRKYHLKVSVCAYV